MTITAVVALAYLVMDFNTRMADLRRLSVERDQVAVEATGLMQTQLTLRTQMAYATSQGAVEQWAYEDGHMARPGDSRVVPLAPSEGTPAPTPVPVVKREVVQNWQLWLWLFSDAR